MLHSSIEIINVRVNDAVKAAFRAAAAPSRSNRHLPPTVAGGPGQADLQQARPFQPVRRLQASGIQGALFADCSAPGA
jgi:hypothetical protein